MDKQTATDFVSRIEAHREQEQVIWQEMRDRPDYAMHEDKVVEAIIDQRANAKTLVGEAQSSLDSFDWVEDENGDLVPREETVPEPAWPTMSAKLREELRDNSKALTMIDHIDKLHALAVSRGFPVPSKEDFEAELARLEHA